MIPAFQITGVWWSPDDFDDKVPGTLTFSNADGITLSTDGRFHRWDRGDIFGRAGDKYFTLPDAELVRGHSDSDGNDSRTYAANHLYSTQVNDFLKRRVVTSVDVGLDKLQGWLGFDDLLITRTNKSSGYAAGLVEFNPRLGTVLHGNDDVTITAFTELDESQSPKALYSGALSQRTLLEFDFQSPLDISDAFRYISKLSNLLSLMTFGRSGITYLRIHVPSHATHFQVDGSGVVEFEVTFPQIEFNARTIAKQIPYSQVSHCISDSISRWLEIYERSSRAIDVFFGVVDVQPPYIDQVFAGLVQALEGYDRDNHPSGSAIPKDKFRWMMKLLRKNFPQYRDFIDSSIANGNRISLRARVTRAMERVPLSLRARPIIMLLE